MSGHTYTHTHTHTHIHTHTTTTITLAAHAHRGLIIVVYYIYTCLQRYNNANCAGTRFYRCLIHMHTNWCFQSKCSMIGKIIHGVVVLGRSYYSASGW